jgi:drug/metabolite transporter (DMT)-like permease
VPTPRCTIGSHVSKTSEQPSSTSRNSISSDTGSLPPLVGLGAAALCVLFGGNAVAIKLALEEMGPFTSAGLRFAIAAATIAAWAAATGRPFGLRPRQIAQVIVLGAAFCAQMGFLYLGLDRTYASRGLLLANLQPFLVMLLAHFFLAGDRITATRLGGVALGFAGVALLMSDERTLSGDLLLGDLLVSASVLFWASSTVYMKRILPDFEPFQLVLFPMLFEAPMLLAAGALWDEPMIGSPNAVTVLSLLYQGMLTAGLGFVIWSTLLKRYGAVSVNTYLFLVPIAGVTLSGLVLGEPVASCEILGALVLITTGVALVNRRPRTSCPAR